ncbi:sodium:proton antiporter [Alteromonadaceae bacterium M269]|nr:sodium:proton antiporter [Alteromonadaceae bacterium M269]
MTIFQIILTLLLVLSNGILAFITARITKLPLTLNVLLWGIVSSALVPIMGIDTGIRFDNFEHLILFVLIPILVFEAALNIHTHLFKPLIGTILFAATFGVLVAMGISAVILFFGIGHASGFPWIAALIAGLVISATDPVAVVSQLKEANAPHKLGTVIEGESLFNDATAIVLFGILVAMATGGSEPSLTGGTLLLLKVLLGGVLVGAVFAVVTKVILKLVGPNADYYVVTSLALAYGGFYVAEHVLHVSGVIAVLIATLMVKSELLALKDDGKVHGNWEMFAFIANIVVFFLMGLVVTFDMFTEQWIAMLLGIVAAFVSRLVAVYFSVFVGKVIFRNDIDWNFAPVMVWGGLRGVVTIALVLALPLELPYWWTIQSIGFGVVLFTLVFQATTNPALLKKLKLTQ